MRKLSKLFTKRRQLPPSWICHGQFFDDQRLIARKLGVMNDLAI